MKTIRYRSRGEEVNFLEQILNKLGYNVFVSNFFGKDTDLAVKDFQRKNNLVVDGVVGLKTWTKLINAEKATLDYLDKLLSEKDLVDFAKQYDLELAVVKAVNEVESNGKGFLIDGRPRILFEGHVFWRELEKRKINPVDFVNDFTDNVLYKKWTKKHYSGGSGEYSRLEKAAGMSDLQGVHDAAYSSASWGAFQIMGYHFKNLGYSSIDSFVSKMYENEGKHLEAFGLFLEKNNLIRHLKSKNWAAFAKGYNGPGYKQNKYDEKLEKAYKKYK
ncbi:N-acetylmuramidase family protein [Aquimarina sp. MMG016]|uniref:N-acetylmuramidase domain-containing protein n=1 Tax=Aquimarina sp. MMG016 TaxID=2822690 RepID=UPI001B3A2882|nr:N-acetylmuramidase family protein [Aquimarina sp. MMG016]MBQ4821029.1 N-acetylmuramidase family protein [Aquimarina sp. MMG016]